jgi:hypothetical protein
VQRVRDIANLNHLGHAGKIETCAAHVKRSVSRESRCRIAIDYRLLSFHVSTRSRGVPKGAETATSRTL